MIHRHRLGSWSTPSGNTCDVYLVSRSTVSDLEFCWDCLPLRAHDEAFYRAVLLPQVARRVQEYLELVGSALVVVLA